MTIPVRFREAILRHAFSVPALEQYPLILAVEGPPGDGKSFQTTAALKESGFTLFRLSGAHLSGGLEAQSVAQLQSLYQKAGQYVELGGTGYPALILEDFDLSPAGQRDGRQYTVNSQLLTGYLMNLADDIDMCDVGTKLRFPIFLTGNDFTVLHGPLARPGRMEFFSWVPTKQERAEIVYAILGPALGEKDAFRLSDKFSHFPISTFTATLQRLLGDEVLRIVTGQDATQIPALRATLAARKVNFSAAIFEAALNESAGNANRRKSFLLRNSRG